MDGYHTDYGFMGLVNGEYMLFSSARELGRSQDRLSLRVFIYYIAFRRESKP